MLYAYTHDDREEAVNTINKYGLIALPVVDKEMRMVGIVTVDDAMDVLQEETTEDINRMADIVVPNEDTYFETTVWQHAKSRFPWLLFLNKRLGGSTVSRTHFAFNHCSPSWPDACGVLTKTAQGSFSG